MAMYGKTLKCLLVKPGEPPRQAVIAGDLAGLQKAVGGYIEAVYPFEDLVAVICNEEGKLLGLPENRPLYDEDGNVYDIICGDFLVVGLGEEDFRDLPDELMKKYMEVFA